MKNKFYHSTHSVPFAQRESFNNTIILLTLIKNKYYYIVGFSRPRYVIEIGFDFESELHGVLTESVTVDFSSDEEYILIDAELKNINFDDPKKIEWSEYKGRFRCVEGKAEYSYKIKKDKVLPISLEVMNGHILTVKKEIIDFLEKNYKILLS